ncbi:prepilin-type N-terminal cleavage/methylation domain-containing protein [Halobacteriovorax sp. HLS]|uniref:type IV pilus modification PilV family protein n=1 Tax=Halobacteriovorax sp. HLS TaxID=2234000 RepID=UPI000FD81B95|nr:prepilin-type N-terminal cleavage/methylation domain-containing protein [Halobacteriovorax sp. HLS]
MVKRIKKIFINQAGFTLIEVMISLAIFSVFVTAYLTAQGYNVTDSTVMRDELSLKRFAEQKINELIIDPPELKESLTLKADAGKFKEDESFSYEVKYTKFELPDFQKIMGTTEEDQDPSQKKIFENVKKNLEKIIWQVEVTVKNENTDRNYSVSTWLYNHQAQIQFEQL